MSSHRLAPVAALAALALLAPPVAQAAWGPPTPVTGSGEDAYALGVAANERDRPAVLFQKRRHGRWTLALRRSDRRGRLGRATVLLRSRHSVGGAGLFAGRGDDLVAGWLEIVNGSRRPVVATGSRLQHRQVLAPGPRSTQILHMAANRRGDAVVAFWRYTGRSYNAYAIWAAVRPAGGRFGAAVPVVIGNVSFSNVAIDEHGGAAVAWTDQTGVHVSQRRAGAERFDAPVRVAAMEHLRGDPGVALDGDHVAVSWVSEDIDGNRTLLVSERTAGTTFSAPVALSKAGVRLPRWLTPSLVVTGGRVLAAWVQGRPFTVDHDVAVLRVRPAGGSWRAPVVRDVPGPAHAYAVDILRPAFGRPALLGLTTARHWHFGVATSTLRGDGRLGPVRVPATGRDGGFRPFLAHGRRHTWLATDRAVGHDRLQRRQVLLFRSN